MPVLQGRLQDLNPISNVMFNILALKPLVVQELISAVVDAPIEIVRQQVQRLFPNPAGREVTMDLFGGIRGVTARFLDDCDFANKGALVNVDVQQARKDIYHINRVKLHQSHMIVAESPAGDKTFANVPNTIVVYIMSFDLFNSGNIVDAYHMTRFGDNNPLNDGSVQIYINSKIKATTESSDYDKKISKMMDIFTTDLHDELLFPELSREKKRLKTTEEGAKEMDDFVEKYGDECRAEGEAKGRAEGEAKGRAEGIVEGEAKGRAEGESLLGRLINLLLSEGRTDDISKASTDEVYRKKLYKKYALA